MISIAICDDDSTFVKIIKQYICNYLADQNIAYSIQCFRSGDELMELDDKEITVHDIFFLDINMDGKNGIEVARRIRDYSDDAFIVFVTAYLSYSLEGYKVNAFRYILKQYETLEESLKECMDKIIEKRRCNPPLLHFDFRECKIDLEIRRIIYIESKLHLLFFHILCAEHRCFTLYGKLDDLEDKLIEYCFVRIHKSYLVNMEHILRLEKKAVIVSGNEELAVARVRFNEVKDSYISFRGGF